MVHGFSEHINRYNDFFPAFAEQGIQVFGFDQRGWGRSVKKPSDKGLTGPTPTVIADVVAFVSEHVPAPDGTPVFLMGHSMGGGEVLTLAGSAEHDELLRQIRGVIVEAPFIAFPRGEEPSSIKMTLGRLVGRLLPRQQLKHVIPPEKLSRDPAWVESMRADELCHDTGTLEGLAALLDRTAALASGQVRLRGAVRSVLLGHGDADLTCDHDASVKWLREQEHVRDRTAKTYEGGYHQLHADVCKEEYARDVVGWILERCGDGGPGESKL